MARMEWGPAEAVGSVPEVEPAEVRPSRRTQATAEDEGLAVAAAEVEVQSGDGEAEGSVVGPERAVAAAEVEVQSGDGEAEDSVVGPERAVAAAEAMDVQPGDGVAEAVPMEAPDGGTSTTHELDAEKELHAADPKPACAAASGLAPLDAEAYRALPSMRVDPSSLPAGCAGTAHNRFADVLPTPGTRVVLPGEDDAAQYINANRLRSPPGEPCRYIAAMGPIKSSICAFWRMLWAERVAAVVMITQLEEGGKPKCEQYWPSQSGATAAYDRVYVECLSVENSGAFTRSRLQLTHLGETRSLVHLQFPHWSERTRLRPGPAHALNCRLRPDHGAPESIEGIIQLLEAAWAEGSPTVVHCSAGIGRTGTFIAIDTAVRRLASGPSANLVDIIGELRQDRGGMVQTGEQYAFAHAVVEALVARGIKPRPPASQAVEPAAAPVAVADAPALDGRSAEDYWLMYRDYHEGLLACLRMQVQASDDGPQIQYEADGLTPVDASKMGGWVDPLKEDAFGGTKEMADTEKDFAQALRGGLDGGGIRRDPKHGGAGEAASSMPDRPLGYPELAGTWLRCMNRQGTCWMYVHSYTQQVQATRPDGAGPFPEDVDPAEQRRRQAAAAAAEKAAAFPAAPVSALRPAVDTIVSKGKLPLVLVDRVPTVELLAELRTWDNSGRTREECEVAFAEFQAAAAARQSKHAAEDAERAEAHRVAWDADTAARKEARREEDLAGGAEYESSDEEYGGFEPEPRPEVWDGTYIVDVGLFVLPFKRTKVKMDVALERARIKTMSAMRDGAVLVLNIADLEPDFERICAKSRGAFPIELLDPAKQQSCGKGVFLRAKGDGAATCKKGFGKPLRLPPPASRRPAPTAAACAAVVVVADQRREKYAKALKTLLASTLADSEASARPSTASDPPPAHSPRHPGHCRG